MKKLFVIAAMMVAAVAANAQITLKPMAGLTIATLTDMEDNSFRPGLAAGAEAEYLVNDMFGVSGAKGEQTVFEVRLNSQMKSVIDALNKAMELQANADKEYRSSLELLKKNLNASDEKYKLKGEQLFNRIDKTDSQTVYQEWENSPDDYYFNKVTRQNSKGVIKFPNLPGFKRNSGGIIIPKPLYIEFDLINYFIINT